MHHNDKAPQSGLRDATLFIRYMLQLIWHSGYSASAQGKNDSIVNSQNQNVEHTKNRQPHYIGLTN